MPSKRELEALRAAEDEVIARHLALNSLKEWIRYREAGIVPARHHELIIDELEKVESGKTKKLMLLCPPGSAKSTYTSVEFPAWWMGRNQDKSVIAASHTYDLAERFGRRCRNIVGSDKARLVFGVKLAEDSQAAGKWETERGGEYFAAGVGGTITGRRADLGLIDDPVASRDDAFSERSRERAWQWYLNDFLTRLKPGAAQILIMTRWHEADLGGRILDREADEWRVVKLPMLATGDDDPLGRREGELLWPEWFTMEMVAAAQKDVVSWNALYQQNPVPEDGEFFRKDWFIEYDKADLPSTLYIYGASDYAVTEGKGDFTEHGIFGVDWSGDIWVLDWWHGQTASDVWIDRKCDLILKHKPIVWFGEAGPIRRAIEPALKRRMEERRAYCMIEWLPSIQKKDVRARPIQAVASMGKVKVPKDKQWMARIMGQLMQFPAGRRDDAVDVFSLIGRGLEFVQNAPRKREKRGFGDTMPAAASWMG